MVTIKYISTRGNEQSVNADNGSLITITNPDEGESFVYEDIKIRVFRRKGEQKVQVYINPKTTTVLVNGHLEYEPERKT